MVIDHFALVVDALKHYRYWILTHKQNIMIIILSLSLLYIIIINNINIFIITLILIEGLYIHFARRGRKNTRSDDPGSSWLVNGKLYNDLARCPKVHPLAGMVSRPSTAAHSRRSSTRALMTLPGTENLVLKMDSVSTITWSYQNLWSDHSLKKCYLRCEITDKRSDRSRSNW